jgi:hypothetical protein
VSWLASTAGLRLSQPFCATDEGRTSCSLNASLLACACVGPACPTLMLSASISLILPTRHNRVRAFRILSGRPWVFRQLYKVASHKWFETFIILVRGVDPVAPRLLMFLLEG